MLVIAWIPLITAILSAVLYLVVKNGDVKALAGWTFLASMIALMLALSGHIVRIGTSP